LLALLLAVGVVFLVPACKKAPVITPEPEPVEAPAPPPEPEPEPVEVTPDFPTEEPEVKRIEPTIAELNAQGVLRTVYFDFDKYDLSNKTRQTLRANADWLNANSKYYIVIEGHCDERGSIEYNLALGERRANAVRAYLASLGVTDSRLRIVSYGEERPADAGHSESAWTKNRRAEFLIER
jgi:peptidoglycan-associated lipoprotein